MLFFCQFSVTLSDTASIYLTKIVIYITCCDHPNIQWNLQIINIVLRITSAFFTNPFLSAPAIPDTWQNALKLMFLLYYYTFYNLPYWLKENLFKPQKPDDFQAAYF